MPQSLSFKDFQAGQKFRGKFVEAHWNVPEEGETFTFTDADGREHVREKQTQLYIEIERTDEPGAKNRFFRFPDSSSAQSKLGLFSKSLHEAGVNIKEPEDLLDDTEYDFLVVDKARGSATWEQLLVERVAAKGGTPVENQKDPLEKADVPAIVGAVVDHAPNDILEAIVSLRPGSQIVNMASDGSLVDALVEHGYIEVIDGEIKALEPAKA